MRCRIPVLKLTDGNEDDFLRNPRRKQSNKSKLNCSLRDSYANSYLLVVAEDPFVCLGEVKWSFLLVVVLCIDFTAMQICMKGSGNGAWDWITSALNHIYIEKNKKER